MRPREHLVLCGGAEPHQHGSAVAVPLQLHGPPANLRLRIQDISTRLVANIPDELVDLLEIASYVYAADAAVYRGGRTDTRLGAFWRRSFRLIVPVRRPEIWASKPVSRALAEMLGFLSDDEYAFEFASLREHIPIQSYLEFSGGNPAAFTPDKVVLFSGGLDSLAGAVDELARHGRTVALVSHRSSGKIADAQKYLVARLCEHFGPNRVQHVPVWVGLLDGSLAHEYTHRTRSFLFAALGAVTARLFGLDRIEFFENGVVSLNLPINGQVVGARATRTTHPQVLAGFREVLSALLGRPFDVANPYIWRTKAEVVGRIAATGFGELIPHTRSCTRVRDMTKLHPHCGSCSQCIDRRFGILAAGLADCDPADGYAVNLFEGSRPPGPDRELALAYVRAAARMRRMNDVAFFSHYGEANRAVSYFTEPAGIVAERIFDLHQRHAQDVVSTVERAIVANARPMAELTLPSDCLLTLAVGSGDEVIAQDDADAVHPKSAVGVADPGPSASRDTVLWIRVHADGRAVTLEGWGTVRGVGAKILLALVEPLREALTAELEPEQYPFLQGKKLALLSGCQNEELLRKRILRLRKQIEEFGNANGGPKLPINAVVESIPWRGYRLNRTLRIVAGNDDEIDGMGLASGAQSQAPVNGKASGSRPRVTGARRSSRSAESGR